MILIRIHKPAILLFAFILAILIAGCNNHKPKAPTNANLLHIPDIHTIFDYTPSGVAVEWTIQPHPRILARPEGIAKLKADPQSGISQSLLNTAMQQRAIMEANPAYHEPLGPVACAWGYLLTGDDKYLQVVRNSLSWLTIFPPIVTAPESANFPFIQQAYSLGAIYDLLYNDLTERDRAKIEKPFRESVFHILAYKVTKLDKNINFWANDPHSNYYVVWHSTAGLVSIALADVEPDAKALASLCYDRVSRSMDLFDKETGWREGLTYLDFCWGQSACYFLLATERNSSLKPYDQPWFYKSVEWATWGAFPDHATIADFGDNEPENYSVGSYLGRVAAISGDSGLKNESDSTAKIVPLAVDLPVFEAACMGRTPGGPPSVINTERDYPEIWKTFPGIEWGVLRTGPSANGPTDENDFYMAFKSGIAGYDHNHLDQGSLIMAAYSEILLSDPGRGGPDIIRKDPAINCLFEAGLGHNTLIVGNGCFMDLGLFPDNPKYFARPGKITSQKETDKYILFTTDNSGLYPSEPLATFRRTFIYVKPGVIKGAELGALVIADRLIFRQPVTQSLLFHTPGTVEILGPGKAKLTNGAARLDYFGFSLTPSTDKSESQKTGMEDRDSTCYFRSTASDQTGSDWVHILIPAKADAAASYEPQFVQSVFGIEVKWQELDLQLGIDPNLGWVVGPLAPLTK